MTDGRCLSGKRCVGRTKDGPAVTARPGTLCPGCITDITRLWVELPHYFTALHSFRGFKPQSIGQSRISGGASEGSTPVNVAVLDLIDEIDALCRAVGGYEVRDLVTLPGGVEKALAIRAAHSKADAIVGLGRVWERRRVPCPECDLPTLGGWLGDDRIFCTNSECGHSLSKGEYEAHCEITSKGSKRA